MIRRTAFIAACTAIVCLLLAGKGFSLDRPIIRVAILRDAVMARVCINGSYSIEDGDSNTVLATGRDLRGAVTAFKFAVGINGKRYEQKKLVLRIEDPAALQVNNRRYRGSLAIIRSRGAMTLINYIDLEDYINGIAVREVSHYWPVEALRAMAIVFRTYAMYSMRQNAVRDFDVTSDVYSQVYGGTSAERYRITDACNETSGDVLTYAGSIFPAFYHSTCGGHTQRSADLWDIDIPPLKGVACAYCKGSAYFSWKARVLASDAAVKLSKAGIKVSSIKSIDIAGRGASGSAADVTIQAREGESVTIKAKDLRNILGPDVIKSTNFTVSVRNRNIEFKGSGWGHGVGLCQWGAYFMAKAGYSLSEILYYYYPGSHIRNIYTQKTGDETVRF